MPFSREKFLGLLSMFALVSFAARFWPSDRWAGIALLTYIPPVFFVLFSFLILLLLRKKDQHQRLGLWSSILLIIGGTAMTLHDNRGVFVESSTLKRSTTNVKILQWNVWGSRAGTANIAKVIVAQDPDVICLNEPKLSRNTPTYPSYTEYLPKHPHVLADRNLMILSRFPMEKSEVINGGGVWGVIVCVRTGRSLKLLFLDVGENFTFSRSDTFERLFKELATKRRSPDLILGDFNTPAGSYSLDSTFGDQYTDSYLRATGSAGYTWPVWFPLMRIDFILASKKLHLLDHKVGFSRLSDHAWQWILLNP